MRIGHALVGVAGISWTGYLVLADRITAAWLFGALTFVWLAGGALGRALNS